jgi:hypothetical protein
MPAPQSVTDHYLRLLAKGRLTREVAAGRRPLLEAAALFRALDRRPPAPADPAGMPAGSAGVLTAEARWCRQVLTWVAALPGPAAPAEAVVARLEAEFAALRRRGPIRLPDPSRLESADSLLDHARAEVAAGLAPRPGQRRRPGREEEWQRQYDADQQKRRDRGTLTEREYDVRGA